MFKSKYTKAAERVVTALRVGPAYFYYMGCCKALRYPKPIREFHKYFKPTQGQMHRSNVDSIYWMGELTGSNALDRSIALLFMAELEKDGQLDET